VKKNPEYNHHLKSLVFTGITLAIVLVSFMGTLSNSASLKCTVFMISYFFERRFSFPNNIFFCSQVLCKTDSGLKSGLAQKCPK